MQDVGVIDLSKIPPARLERARERGQKIHTATEIIDRDGMDLDWSTVEEEFLPHISAWISFVENERFVIDQSMIEQPTYHTKRFYGCTADRRGDFHWDIGPVPAVIEIKNTYSSENYWRMQSAAQENAMRSHDWLSDYKDPALRAAVNLKKDGTYELQWHHNPYRDVDGSKDFHDFLCCLRTYQLKRMK
jgi:hypothetical protein